MFCNSFKLSAHRNCRQVLKQTHRHISKTSSVPNSDALTPRQLNSENISTSTQPTKWMRLRKFNNNRAVSTLNAKIAPKGITSTVASKDESREFMSVFPDLVRDLTEAGRHVDIPEVTKWYAKVLQYNVPNGKKNRGLALVMAYKMFEDEENLTIENIRLANILGWCVEMLQAFFLVNDDIVDGSETRRGNPCWYKKEDVGLNAVNDAILLNGGIYSILRKYLGDHQCYVPCLELFHDVTFKTALGQILDGMCKDKNCMPKLDTFTMKQYNSIVKYKTAYYSFQLPVALAMYLSGKFDPELHRQAKTILLEMGHFFQVQDDFLDCFGDTALTGKVGTDIREGKCSWLVVVALQRANSAQRQLLKDCYGRPEPEAQQAVRNLYEELGLPNMYAIYEEESYNIIKTHIQQISGGLPHKLFFKILEQLYRRDR